MGVVTPKGAFASPLCLYKKVGDRMGRRPKNYVTPPEILKIECVRCGKTKEETEFYANRWSNVYNINKKIVPLCKDCVGSLMEEYTKRFDEQTALSVVCANLDMPFLPELYTDMVAKTSCFTFGMYVRQLQRKQFQHKNFQTSITDGEILKSGASQKEAIEVKWNKTDKTNKNFVISVIGYDPFEDCGMSDEDRKYCYNLLAGYCDIDGVKDDSHKMIGCIQIVQNQLQIRKIDEIITPELDDPNFDDSKLKSLTESKKKLQDNITKIAQDNNISSKSNGKRGKNAFTQKMKDMSEDGYEPSRPNLFDIKTSESFKQVAVISAQCIGDQLAFDDSEYSAMVKEQREIITDLRGKNEILEEENRNLKNELNDIKRVGKKRGV